MLSFTGIGSGLAVSDIVDALVGAESVPFESRLNAKESTYTTDISAVGALKSALESVQESIESLADADNYQKRTVSGGDTFLAVTSNKDAEVGSYSIKVDALASEHKLSSAGFESTDELGEGTLTFTSGENSFDIVASATNTLSDIRDAINDSDDNTSMVATIITGDDGQHLVLSSKETGVENAISITVDDTSDGNNTDNVGLSRLAFDPAAVDSNGDAAPISNLTEVTAAKDAQITIDGTLVVTNSTNTFTDVIDGIDITAEQEHGDDDDISNIGVSENNNNVAAGLNSFVASYNELLTLSNTLGSSSESGAGVMAGDSLLRGLMTKLRSELSTSFSTSDSDSTSLSQLGVTSDRYGVLSLDTDTLDEFIKNDVDGVQRFFVGTDSSSGFASSMDELMGFYTDPDGLIQGRIDSRTSQLEKIDDDREVFARKMDALESRLLAQYNAMDLLVAQLGATGDYVTAQLDNMPGVVRNNN
jgi:flagellar hook-associated protein 2